MVTRRSFLSQAALAGARLALPVAASATVANAAMRWDADAHANASPVAPTPVRPQVFTPLPLGAVRPTGWLSRQLRLQADGLSGHLDETWPDVGSNSAWLGGTGESFERGPYWLDGLIPLAYLLDDERLKRKAQPWVEWVLRSQRSDGNFGPVTKNNDWWPRMVMLKALAQYAEATGDARVLPFLRQYFAYQLQALPGQPLRTWGKFRWQDNVLTALWLYDRQPSGELLQLVRLLQEQGYDWQQQFAQFQYTGPTPRALCKEMMGTGGFHETHGVDIAMGLKSAAVWSRVSHAGSTGDTAAMLAVLDRYHGLPNGLYSASEHLAGRDPSQGTELCTVVELMYSLEQAIAASGDLSLADRLETVAYNALPGTLTDDMWAHQYDQQPNQIECSHVQRPWDNGPDANLFGLEPNFGCCTANFHQGWPKLIASLWMRSADDGLAAIVYGPCTVETTVAGTPARLEVHTEYPFRGNVQIRVAACGRKAFPIHLRVPGFDTATVRVNGSVVRVEPSRGAVRLYRRWSAGDTVELHCQFVPQAVAGVSSTVSFRRGPLVFSLPLAEQWTRLRDQGLTADWQVTTTAAWAYGVDPASKISVTERAVSATPFGKSDPPVTLSVLATPLSQWQKVSGSAGRIPTEPVLASGPAIPVRLVPYASTKLRLTAFPRIEGEQSLSIEREQPGQLEVVGRRGSVTRETQV